MNIPGIARTSRPSASVNDTTDTHELPEVTIGKDVLELVSSAMYVDPMSVYREYIQNAADAVDAARAAGLLGSEEPGRVDVDVDPTTRSVRIRDNGCGIPFESFGGKLTAVGGSEKRGTTARGFRGVGRLAGLGYAQELIFRSCVNGEDKVSELRWDCRQLRTALRNSNDHVGVADVIRDVTKLRRIQSNKPSDRFFEVELRGIVRQRNDRLMSPAAIREYLGQVGPVPFSPEFALGQEITERLGKFVKLGALNIHVDGGSEPIYRPHRDVIELDEKLKITFSSLATIDIPGVEGDTAAIAWILHHDYEGAIPNSAHIKGLRLRVGDIQVGDQTLLEDLFPEPRFNAWSVGEVHILDRRLVPNGRRDHFEQTTHFNNLTNHLTPTARDIARRCRTSSVRRKWQREFELHQDAAKQKLDVIKQGSLSRPDRKVLMRSVNQSLQLMEKISSKDLLADEQAGARTQVIASMRDDLESIEENVDFVTPLAHLSQEKRAMYEHMFGLIYECSINRIAAKSLIDRIISKIQEC